MKILVVVSSFPSVSNPVSGIFFANLLERVAANGYQVSVIHTQAVVRLQTIFEYLTSSISEAHDCKGMSVTEVYHPAFGKKYLGITAREIYRMVAPLARRMHRVQKFDLVAGYGFAGHAFCAAKLGSEFHIPSVSWAIGSDVNTYPCFSTQNLRLLQFNARQNDLVITESQALEKRLRMMVPDVKVVTYYKGISLSEVPVENKKQIRQALEIPSNAILMTSAGNFRKAKGCVEFFETFIRLAGEYPNLQAAWIGGGVMAEPIRQKLKAKDLLHRTHLPGKQPRKRVLGYLAASDLMAFPSHAEGLPNVVMEGLAVGLPVVATDVGGIREVVVPGRTGWLVPARDTDALTDAVRVVLDDLPAARRCAQAGQRIIMNHFDVQKNSLRLGNIFQKLCAGGSEADTWHSMPTASDVLLADEGVSKP